MMDLRRTFQPPVDQTARIISGLSSEMMFSDYMLQWLEIVKTRIKPAMKPDYISSTFSVLLEKKGLKRIRFHDLRHSCASLLLANGVPMKQIQEWLGHSDFNTTANIYAHLDYSSKVTSAQAMEKGLPLPAGFNTNGWNGVVSI